MFVRLVFTLTVISMLISGCTPTREITYNISSIQPVSSLESVSVITRGLTLSIEPFDDIRQTIPQNGILFVRERETTLNEKDYCINSEEHYKKNSVPYQVAKIMARHFNKRGTFKYVSSDSNRSSDYYLTGKLRRLYGEQELSSSARAGSYFGLIGALATSGATTNGTIAIEFTDLVVHRKSDGAKIKLEDVQDRFAGELHADAYCWCIYDNVNDQLKLSVDKMAAKIEKSISTLESTK